MRLLSHSLRLLDRKDALLAAVREMNDSVSGTNGVVEAAAIEKEDKDKRDTIEKVTKMAADGNNRDSNNNNSNDDDDGMSDAFRQKYAWLIVNLERTNRLLDPALARLRQLAPTSIGCDAKQMTQAYNSKPVAEWAASLSESCGRQADEIVSHAEKNILGNDSNKHEAAIMTDGGEDDGENDGRLCSSSTDNGDGVIHADAAVPEGRSAVHSLVSHCVSLLLVVQNCAEKSFSQAEIHRVLDTALAKLAPLCQENMALFRALESSIDMVKSSCRLEQQI
jgi:hypothetical protein